MTSVYYRERGMSRNDGVTVMVVQGVCVSPGVGEPVTVPQKS